MAHNKESHSKEELAALRSKAGMSNAHRYNESDAPFAGKHGTFPLGKGGKLSPQRVRAALSLAHNAKDPGKIKSKIASEIKGKMPSLAAKIRSRIKGDK